MLGVETDERGISAGFATTTPAPGFQPEGPTPARRRFIGRNSYKDRIAQIITLGQVGPYQIHIGWRGQTEFVFDQSGALVSAKG
ncbi:hypothetical protein [Mycobacteroides abscessus]|uniref:Uncharacterized protein n=2 Tax=Mycobacteroides abscessus TaxID=36809 RepID=A0A0U0ZML0_9MYCO|nr:hypothetical protein [Mycobacteroides abscessus]EUA69808.1 hypothetical protein I540_2660 [Mycobacteroides abscessus subsp. bolletii 1513]AMU68171.1 hypothetical protein A3O04_04670 [Mycobacteroides abscessus]ANO01748.1 hypothetical protein BAB74_12545 [Mycobacteroides abscessus]ANO16702.1 hypothetical protein BAB77_04805 [Mycobacteroides abscessus]ARQ67043.1 hypothetical protein CAK77_04955 [Mycobacteroides abscessus subsp. massiliense]